jgi:hypothetical protein
MRRIRFQPVICLPQVASMRVSYGGQETRSLQPHHYETSVAAPDSPGRVRVPLGLDELTAALNAEGAEGGYRVQHHNHDR